MDAPGVTLCPDRKRKLVVAMVTDKPKHLHFPLLLLHDQLVHPLILHEILARHEKKYSHWLSTCSKFNSKAAFLVKHVKGLLRSAELARDDVVFRVKMALFSKSEETKQVAPPQHADTCQSE